MPLIWAIASSAPKMSDELSRSERTLALAEEVGALLESLGIPAAVIGGVALAAHGYARGTDDFDLGVIVMEPGPTFRDLAALLPEDFQITINLPDDSDPLGGVMTVQKADTDPIEIVNFLNIQRLTTLTPGLEAVRKALDGLIEGSNLRVVDLPHLIALKLYAGGLRSKADVLELLEHNRDADIEMIRQVCKDFELENDLNSVLDELS